jgi:hypothetical protein
MLSRYRRLSIYNAAFCPLLGNLCDKIPNLVLTHRNS